MNQFSPSNNNFAESLKNAILAPASNMLVIEDFEASFDSVRHHLKLALQYAAGHGEPAVVRQVAQQLFNLYIQMIVRLITQGKQGSSEQFIQQLGNGQSFAELARQFNLADCVAIVTLDTLRIALFGFVQKLFRDAELRKKSARFYLQVGRTYRKIVFSELYTDEYQLIRDTIDNHTMDIINGIIVFEEFEGEGIEFVANLKARNFRSAARAENELLEGYRKHLMGGYSLKGATKVVKRGAKFFTYQMFFGLGLLILLFLLIHAGGAGVVIWLAAAIGGGMALRYYWRCGPQIAAMRQQIEQRAAGIRTSLLRQ
jgi:hypothetical protein